MAEQNIGKEIILKDIGQRKYSPACHQKDLKQVGSIKAVDTGIDKNTCNMMTFFYLQESYPFNNSSVWLSIYLAVHLIHLTQAEIQARFEWLIIFNKNQIRDFTSLFDMLRQTPGVYLDLCRISLYKDYKSSTITE